LVNKNKNRRIMNNDFVTILPGEGFGKLRFSMTRDEVVNVAGKPDEIEDFTYSGETVETWHYDKYDFSISFEKNLDSSLDSIAISSPDALLNGERLIDKTKSEVVQILNKMNITDFEEETVEEDQDTTVTLLSFYDLGLILWFENDFLTEIQLGIFEDEEDS
jgi:hypothetical protein